MNNGTARMTQDTAMRPDGAAFQLLSYLAEAGCSPEGEVAQALPACTPTTVAKALRELEQAGLIKRRYVALTPAGLAAMEKVERRVATRVAGAVKAP